MHYRSVRLQVWTTFKYFLIISNNFLGLSYSISVISDYYGLLISCSNSVYPVYLSLFWSISVHLGLSWFILLYLGLSWAFSSYLGPFWTISDYLWQSDKMTVVWPNDILTFTFYVIISKSIPNWDIFEKWRKATHTAAECGTAQLS